MTHVEVAAWVAFMREHGVKRLAVNGLSLELGGITQSQSTATEPMAQQGVFEDSTGSVCACGHSIAIEHTPDGCMHGCSTALCVTTWGATNVGS